MPQSSTDRWRKRQDELNDTSRLTDHDNWTKLETSAIGGATIVISPAMPRDTETYYKVCRLVQRVLAARGIGFPSPEYDAAKATLDALIPALEPTTIVVTNTKETTP